MERVPRHTAEFLNRRIERDIEQRIRFFADNPALIEQRLGELDREWDIERLLETGITGDRRRLALPFLVVAESADRGARAPLALAAARA